MHFGNFLFHLLIVCLCKTFITLAQGPTKDEIHEFRWSASAEWNKSACAIAAVPPRHPNTTSEILFWRNAYLSIYYGAHAGYDRSASCFTELSLFRLVGNPGIIWHPQSNQCVHTRAYSVNAAGDYPARPEEAVGFVKVLKTSYICESDHPDMAFFKYDKNKPQRLSYLAPVDKKLNKREEWCVRNSMEGTIEVDPVCNSSKYVSEAFFHEVT